MRWLRQLGLGLGLSALLATSGAHAQQQFVNVLTGGQSGVYYPLGVALSQVYGKTIPGARATAQVTKASAETLNLLSRLRETFPQFQHRGKSRFHRHGETMRGNHH